MLVIKTPEQRHDIGLVSLLLTLKMFLTSFNCIISYVHFEQIVGRDIIVQWKIEDILFTQL